MGDNRRKRGQLHCPAITRSTRDRVRRDISYDTDMFLLYTLHTAQKIGYIFWACNM